MLAFNIPGPEERMKASKHTQTVIKVRRTGEKRKEVFLFSLSPRPLEGLFGPPLVIPLRDKCLHPAL